MQPLAHPAAPYACPMPSARVPTDELACWCVRQQPWLTNVALGSETPHCIRVYALSPPRFCIHLCIQGCTPSHPSRMQKRCPDGATGCDTGARSVDRGVAESARQGTFQPPPGETGDSEKRCLCIYVWGRGFQEGVRGIGIRWVRGFHRGYSALRGCTYTSLEKPYR